MRQMTGLNELRERGLMTWIEQEHGWVAAPEEIVKAFSKDGFEECNRETTTSRRDWQPPGGVWQGVDTRTGSVASATWVNRPPWHQAIMAGGGWQAAHTKTVASRSGEHTSELQSLAYLVCRLLLEKKKKKKNDKTP